MEVLAFVLDHAPVSLREAADHFAEPAGLARTTVHTVLERLRKKGYLDREQLDGVLKYRPAVERSALINGLIAQFISARLGGSISPFVAYLSQAKGLPQNEIDELKALVKQLEERQ
jgi:predicted transcriptional regulator